MATARELRQHAAELFAIAMDARDKGDDELAKLITARVTQHLQQASDTDRIAGIDLRARTVIRSVR
jgi:hypothetical protein